MYFCVLLLNNKVMTYDKGTFGFLFALMFVYLPQN